MKDFKSKTAVITGGALAKVKLRYVFGVELDDRIERAPHLVAETAQRANLAPGEQFLNFGGLKLAAGDDFPQRKVTGLALEFLVRLLDQSSALGARGGEFAKIAGDTVTVVTLRPIDDALGHGSDLPHEVAA